ncbi:hypothetical protein F5H01DRAFT_340464 [Linnemannia elongata]|nr:hypothetical protein F5H01DRAFT_340464 [Linnemannia elongata]
MGQVKVKLSTNFLVLLLILLLFLITSLRLRPIHTPNLRHRLRLGIHVESKDFFAVGPQTLQMRCRRLRRLLFLRAGGVYCCDGGARKMKKVVKK